MLRLSMYVYLTSLVRCRLPKNNRSRPQGGYLNIRRRIKSKQRSKLVRFIILIISSSLLVEEATLTLVRRPGIRRQRALVAILLLISHVGGIQPCGVVDLITRGILQAQRVHIGWEGLQLLWHRDVLWGGGGGHISVCGHWHVLVACLALETRRRRRRRHVRLMEAEIHGTRLRRGHRGIVEARERAGWVVVGVRSSMTCVRVGQDTRLLHH